MGKVFLRQDYDYAAAIASALQMELGGSHQAIETAMKWTGANSRTVKNWFAGSSGPSGEHLVALARHSDEVLTAFLTMAGRGNVVTSTKLLEARNAAAEFLNALDKAIDDRSL